MINLAGNPDADSYIAFELEKARIPAEHAEPTRSEVPYTIIGRLGSFTFIRAWRYSVANGQLPLDIAEELSADPVGQYDIRAGGHAAATPPAEHATWLTPDGKEVFPAEQEADYLAMLERHPDFERNDRYIFSDEPESVGARRVVSLYHIDTEVGLRVFADTLRIYNLVEMEAVAATQ